MKKIHWLERWKTFVLIEREEIGSDGVTPVRSGRVMPLEEALLRYGASDDCHVSWTLEGLAEMERLHEACDERECPGCGKPVGEHGTPNGYCCFTCAVGRGDAS